MYSLRFDMRAPASGASTTDLYRAAIEMAEWGEDHGCLAAMVSEHHAAADGYLPSPLVLASAIGVAAGALVAQYVNPRYLSYAAGVGFIVIGAWTIYAASGTQTA